MDLKEPQLPPIEYSSKDAMWEAEYQTEGFSRPFHARILAQHEEAAVARLERHLGPLKIISIFVKE